MSTEKKHTLSVGDISALFGWSPRFIESLVRAEKIPVLESNGQYYFDRQDVVDWLDQKINTLDDGRLSKLEHTLEAEDSALKRPADAPLHKITEALAEEVVGVDLDLSSKRTVIEHLAKLAHRGGRVTDEALLLASVLQRESLYSTALPGGVAICHPRRPLPAALSGLALALIRTSTPVTFGAEGGEGTRLFFLVAALDERSHLYSLSRIARLLRSEQVLATLLSDQLSSAAEIVACLKEAESKL